MVTRGREGCAGGGGANTLAAASRTGGCRLSEKACKASVDFIDERRLETDFKELRRRVANTEGDETCGSASGGSGTYNPIAASQMLMISIHSI